MARSVGEGVTDLGVLLYPPLDFSSMTTKGHDQEIADDDRDVAPRLGRTALRSSGSGRIGGWQWRLTTVALGVALVAGIYICYIPGDSYLPRKNLGTGC